MNPLIKFGLFILALLFIMSTYKDLTVGTMDDSSHSARNQVTSTTSTHSQAAHIKVQEGETVLSIVEQLNQESVQTIDIDQILDDFKRLNPDAKPLKIKAGKYYYFPLY
ncbi:hypothetical protein GCM10009001_19060 [Virgibacillus siamensis]|uniref:LysM domain-containing protein n=1 Tax=Virgibacillus siamensis TaxID=480071 RepID=A0ABP3R2D0_9BACI